MLSFLLAVTVNSFLFMSFLGVSMAHANGDDTPLETDVDTNTGHYNKVVNHPTPPEPMTTIMTTYKPTLAPKKAALRRRPCGDRGFDIVIIEQSKLGDKPVQVTDLTDDDCLQINYQRKRNAVGQARIPKISVVNFADDSGAYVKLDGITVAEVLDGQFMSPDNINLVAV